MTRAHPTPQAHPDPQVTVIVPLHNSSVHLPGLLGCLERNDPARLHVRFVDDRSTDDPAAALAPALDRHPHWSLQQLSGPHASAGAARNLASEDLRTDWVTYLDADDWLRPGYLPALVSEAGRLEVDLLRTDHVVAEGRRRTLRRVPSRHRGGRVGSPRDAILPADQPTIVDHPYAWAGIYHRRLAEAGLLRFDPALRTAEDRPWIWRLLLATERYAVAQQVGYLYRRDLPQSLSRVADERQLDFFAAQRAIAELLRTDPDGDRFWPKARRRGLELLLRQWSLRHRFTAELRARFEAAASDWLTDLAGLEEGLATMTAERAATVRRIRDQHRSAA